MARISTQALHDSKVSFVREWVDKQEMETAPIRRKWEQNFEQFAEGSKFPEKDESWQSDISTGKYETRIRAAAAQARDVIFNRPDFWQLKPLNDDNKRARELSPLFKRYMDVLLRKGKFKRKASTFLLNGFIGMGSTYVGWKKRLVPNPEYLVQATSKQETAENKELAKHVANPQQTLAEAAGVELDIDGAVEDLESLLFEGKGAPKKKVEPYIEVGGLDIGVIDPDNRFWDPHVAYIEESAQGAYRTSAHLWEIIQDAERGFYDKKAVKEIEGGEKSPALRRQAQKRQGLNTQKDDRIELLTYFGPLILERVDGTPYVKHERWGCVIANSGVIIKEWEEYPYWEPAEHEATPFVDASVKEVPLRATGAGAGDNAVKCARWLDSNLNLANDAMRFNLSGLNVVDFANLADPTILETGIEPGKFIETLTDPKKVFTHINLTSNVENQWTPVAQAITESVDEQIGMDDMSLGGPVQRSRVTASEVQARTGGTRRTVNNIALDLELTFIVPFLEKCFARMLQFGFQGIQSNPELKEVFSEAELEALAQLADPRDRMNILHNYYTFEIKGFSSEVETEDRINKLNDLLSIANSGGPVGQLVNVEVLVRELVEALDVSDADEIVASNTELGIILKENQLLVGQNKQVAVSPQDNHELHAQSHGMLLNTAASTQALQQHYQQHVQIVQQQQMAQQQAQAAQNGAPSRNGAPPAQPPSRPVAQQ